MTDYDRRDLYLAVRSLVCCENRTDAPSAAVTLTQEQAAALLDVLRLRLKIPLEWIDEVPA